MRKEVEQDVPEQEPIGIIITQPRASAPPLPRFLAYVWGVADEPDEGPGAKAA